MAVNIGPKIGIDGEKEFRQEMSNIIQQGKTLSAQMDSVSTAFKNADDSEKDYSAVTKKLNEQIANQEKLVEKMREAVERSTKETGENSTTTLKWKEQLAKAEKGLSDMQAKAKGAADGVDDLGKEEAETSKQTSIFGDVLKANLATEAIKKGLKATADAVKDIAKFFVKAVKGAADYADEVNELATVTGLSTDAVQEYRYAADLLDTDFSTIQGSLKKLTSSMSNAKKGSGDAADAFKTLGVRVTNADGSLRSANDVFEDAIDALGKIDNEAERDATAMKLFGKSAQDLNPLIKAGSKSLGELRKEAHDVGAVMEGETLESMSAFKDGLDRLKNGWEALKNTFGATLGAKLLPDLEKFVGLFQDLLKTGDIESFMSGVTDMFKNLIKKLPTFINNVLREVPKIIKNLAKSGIFESIGAAIGDSLAAILTNAPAIIEAGIQLCWGLIKGVVMIIPNLVDKIVNGFGDSKAQQAIDKFAEETKAKVQSVIDKLNDIPTATERMEGAFTDLNAKQAEAERWVKIFDELSKKTNPTAEETERLQTAVDKLNELYPELGIAIDKETGKWNKNAHEIRDNIKALNERYLAEAYLAAASDTMKERIRLEQEKKKVNEEQTKATWDLIESQRELERLRGLSAKQVLEEFKSTNEWIQAKRRAEKAVKENAIAYEGLTVQMDEYGKKIRELKQDEDDLYNQGIAKQEEYTKKQEELAAQREQAEQIRITRQNAVIDDSAKRMAQAVNKARNDIDGLAVDILDTATDVQGEIDKRFLKIVEPLPDKFYRVGDLAGRKLSQGTAAGIKAQLDVIKQEAANAVQSAINEMKRRAQIKSPSRVTKNLIGKNLALGVIEGWEEEFTPSRLKNTFALDGAIGAMQTNGNTVTNNANYGGVSVNVYTRDGESANAVAEAVMRKIQTAVDQRRAVFA